MMIAETSKQMIKVDQVSLDITKLAQSVEAEIKASHPLSDECCIYRVPKSLRAVSIGPLHHGRKGLKEMEEQKIRYLQVFLQLSKVDIEELIQVIQKNEIQLRNCYAETIKLSSEKFLKMILLDAVFIIMLFLKPSLSLSGMESSCPGMKNNIDRIYDKPWKIHVIRYDLILLENQLPFFILHELLEASQIPALHPGLSMVELSAKFIEDFDADWLVEDNMFAKSNSFKMEHLVDQLRICMLPPKLGPKKELQTLNTPTITELKNAGAKFKLSSSKSLFDIKFDKIKGILEIPQIHIEDDTEILLRNIQAFEQCHLDENDYLCDYIGMMKRLVNSPKDVNILVEDGIIENWLWGNEGVSNLFHNLSRENLVSADDFYYSDLIEELNEFCKTPSHKWKATLKQDYFGTPWAAISVIAASILLVLTVIQTVCSIIQL